MSLFERITTLSLSLIPDVVFCHPFFVGAMPAVGLWILLVPLFEGTLCSSKKSISWKSKSTPVNKLFFFPEVVLPFCGTQNFDESMWDFRSPTRQAWKLWIWRRDTICEFFSKKHGDAHQNHWNLQIAAPLLTTQNSAFPVSTHGKLSGCWTPWKATLDSKEALSIHEYVFAVNASAGLSPSHQHV